MGMFDTLHCDHVLPDDCNEREFQIYSPDGMRPYGMRQYGMRQHPRPDQP